MKKAPVQFPKMQMAYQIMQAFQFLGIDPERFEELKKEFGGLKGLHDEIGKRLS